MLSAAKRLYGRYFDISDSNADILVHRFYLDFAPGVPIREAARKRILELKRNWQRKIIRAIRDHVQSEVLRQPNLLHWSEDKVEAHFHSAYDLEAMETKILKPISKVVDVKAIFRGKLASLYVAWYIHVCRLILKEIAPYLRSNDPDMRKRIRGHRHTEEVYHAFRTIALQNTYEEVRVEDVPIKAPRGNGGERNNRIKTA
ncbi:hypothetical protein BZA05DRAFT_412463 [Tricharina praecox]|uniref:uncharacterized protein n=1 Tax=Tricharina praecox TaxID=43433 RepID=UPI002220C5C7|nr:uncharacterized protein BZA05DRAFT_412463 [Tricharina praecox]KAI5842258.1 hypothetical protein BZA05DRAFT_412463 [Tricharina praecox]